MMNKDGLRVHRDRVVLAWGSPWIRRIGKNISPCGGGPDQHNAQANRDSTGYIPCGLT